MKLFLIGFMGAGKSLLAQEIGNHYSIPFYDLDDLIENEVGQTISWIFETKGKRRFRQIERDVLNQFLNNTKGSYVLALGGGAPCHYNNLEKIKKLGTVIFLETPIETIFERLLNFQNEIEKRPLLNKTTKNDLIKLYNKRLPKYRQAHISCEVSSVQTLDLLTKRVDLLTKL